MNDGTKGLLDLIVLFVALVGIVVVSVFVLWVVR